MRHYQLNQADDLVPFCFSIILSFVILPLGTTKSFLLWQFQKHRLCTAPFTQAFSLTFYCDFWSWLRFLWCCYSFLLPGKICCHGNSFPLSSTLLGFAVNCLLFDLSTTFSPYLIMYRSHELQSLISFNYFFIWLMMLMFPSSKQHQNNDRMLSFWVGELLTIKSQTQFSPSAELQWKDP